VPEEISYDCKAVPVFRGEETVIADLGEPPRHRMLEEASDKFHGRDGDRIPLARFRILAAKYHDAVFNVQDAAIGDGDAMEVVRRTTNPAD